MGLTVFYFWGFFWGIVILCMFYFLLPVAPLRFISSRYGNSLIFRLITPPLAGILLGFYCFIGSFLAIKYFAFDENVLSYLTYTGNPFQTITPIAGAISGIVIQIGMRYKTRVEKVFFNFGVFILCLVALYTALLILVPE
jgi:hypothetical protein